MKIFRMKRQDAGKYVFNGEKLFLAARRAPQQVYEDLGTRREGLYEAEAQEKRKQHGVNEIVSEKNASWFVLLIKAFINPFIGILMFLALVSIFMDVLLAAPEDREWMTVIIISIMVTLSGLIRFQQEWKSNKASEALRKMVNNKASVFRKGMETFVDINMADLVPGDVIFLSAGDS